METLSGLDSVKDGRDFFTFQHPPSNRVLSHARNCAELRLSRATMSLLDGRSVCQLPAAGAQQRATRIMYVRARETSYLETPNPSIYSSFVVS